jgi:hypothetical protein
LIGLNSSGKSSVLQFLEILKQSALGNYGNLVTQGPLINLGNLTDILYDKNKRGSIVFGISGSRNTPSDEIIYEYSCTIDQNGVKTQGVSVRSNAVQISIDYDRKKPSKQLTRALRIGEVTVNATPIVLYPMQLSSLNAPLDQEEVNEILDVLRNEVKGFFMVPAIRGISSPSYPLDHVASEDLVDSQNLNQQSVKFASTVVYESPEIERKINKWLTEITGVTIRARTIPDKQGAVEVHRRIDANIVNEGFGTNQLAHLFAQIATSPPNSLIGIEEPEVHLHPKAQSALAKVLAEIAKHEGKRLIITTHSEHVLYKLLTMIAKGTLSQEDLIIYNFKLNEQGITVADELEVDKKGKLSKGLPDFLDVDLEEFRDYLQCLKA